MGAQTIKHGKPRGQLGRVKHVVGLPIGVLFDQGRSGVHNQWLVGRACWGRVVGCPEYPVSQRLFPLRWIARRDRERQGCRFAGRDRLELKPCRFDLDTRRGGELNMTGKRLSCRVLDFENRIATAPSEHM